MGTSIGDILEPLETSFDALSGKVIAVDAYNTLYQFLSTIRQPDGTPLKDSSGRTTSHLSGLIYRTTNLMEKGLKLIFVFDGKPPELKAGVIKARTERREAARKKWEEAEVPEEALKYAKASTRIDVTIVEESKQLLTYMGIPHVQALSEGEAQAAYMVIKGDAEFVCTQDYDSLLFGAPRVIRNLSAPRKKARLEVLDLHKFVQKQGITREELIDLAILVGTDFNDGVKGIGAKTALKLIKKYHSIEKIIANSKIAEDTGIENYELVRDIFLVPDVSDSYEIAWRAPDVAKLKEMLCEEHEFAEERVCNALERSSGPKVKQGSIEQWL
ncbi:flap endonuclease-1 [Candidatus Methanophagaceae archaeon]|nr:flap endonuclease-1 [Methanophagales archaeon]KAF5434970.1 flap endonuclease-1 [Methanophagales archaeon]